MIFLQIQMTPNSENYIRTRNYRTWWNFRSKKEPKTISTNSRLSTWHFPTMSLFLHNSCNSKRTILGVYSFHFNTNMRGKSLHMHSLSVCLSLSVCASLPPSPPALYLSHLISQVALYHCKSPLTGFIIPWDKWKP